MNFKVIKDEPQNKSYLHPLKLMQVFHFVLNAEQIAEQLA